jgi:alanine racemase
MIDKSKRSWVKVNKNNLVSNFRNLSKQVDSINDKKTPKPKKMVVVKSNAYGHGMIGCAKTLEKAGADFLAVDSFDEAVELRKSKIKKPVLVLGWTAKENFAEASRKNISITISNLKSLKDVVACNKKIKIHIKADTGLHRQGFFLKDIPEIKKTLSKINSKNKNRIIVEGLYSHFAGAESDKFISYTNKQIKELELWINDFGSWVEEVRLGKNILTHCAASAAAILYPNSHFKMVRFGISLYGLWASEETKKKTRGVNLKPALAWQSIITETKTIKKGSAIGYDCSEKVKRDSVIGIVPIGYWHGYPRHASRKAYVSIKGKKTKVLGNVSMDMIVVDLTNIKNPKQGDIVTLIGKDKKNEISAEELAQYCDTINYEIVTRINSEIPRILA